MSDVSRLEVKDHVAVAAFDDPNLDEKDVLEFGELQAEILRLIWSFLTLSYQRMTLRTPKSAPPLPTRTTSTCLHRPSEPGPWASSGR